jgi:Polymer-forming cytoskeletal
MSAATFGTETSAAPAILAESVSVTGEIYCNEPLTIEGEMEGSIDVTDHLLTIEARGNVRANVRAGEIDVLGSLQGNVEGTERISIRNGTPIRRLHSRARHCHRGRGFRIAFHACTSSWIARAGGTECPSNRHRWYAAR